MPAFDPSAARLLFLCVCCLPRRPATLSRAPAPAPESGHPSYLCLFTAPSLLCIRVPVPSGIPGGGGNCCAFIPLRGWLPFACGCPASPRAPVASSLLSCCPGRARIHHPLVNCCQPLSSGALLHSGSCATSLFACCLPCLLPAPVVPSYRLHLRACCTPISKTLPCSHTYKKTWQKHIKSPLTRTNTTPTPAYPCTLLPAGFLNFLK